MPEASSGKVSCIPSRLTEEQRSALDYLSHFLGQIGSANDAEDHGYLDEARRLREESSDGIRSLLRDAPFVAELFPQLEEQLKNQGLFIVGWAFIRREVAALLALPVKETANDEKGK